MFAPPQSYGWHQLIHATHGVVRVKTVETEWLAPPGRAVWLPAGSRYELEWRGEIALRMLYVWPERLPAGRGEVIAVTPLLRELIVRANLLGALDEAKPEQARLAGVIVDELSQRQGIGLDLPLPRDARALRFARGKTAGASRRTLERIFLAETGWSLGRWLRRRKALWAVAWLAEGESVANVAERLEYSSPSAFIAMFEREMGTTPGRYCPP